MKKFFFFAAAAIVALSSCNNEEVTLNNGNQSTNFPTFTATIEGAATRTTLDNEGKVNWENSDEVLMMFVNINDPENSASMPVYTVTPGLDATTATLSIKDGEVYDENCNLLVMAVYPASSFTNTGNSFPATQTYAGDDKIPYAPMVFLNPMTEPIPANLQFKNATSLLKITVPYSQMHSVSSITVSSNLVMNGVVTYDAKGYFYINAENCGPVSDENSKLTLSCGNVEIPADGSKTFYISILPLSSETEYHVQAQCYDYLQIDVTDGTTTKSMRTNKAGGIQVDRNKIYPITFAENVAPAVWENALYVDRSEITYIEFKTSVDVSEYEEDENHYLLNNDGTLWAVVDGMDMRIQTSSNKIIAPTDCSFLFSDYPYLSEIEGLDKLDVSVVTDMTSMFENCSSLLSLDLSAFNTANVENMTQMFMGCSYLMELNLTSFNTEKVTNMTNMFFQCSNLENLYLSPLFNTGNVYSMNSMFAGCSSLSDIDGLNFNTEKVEDMYQMFAGCSNLLDFSFLENFNTSIVTNMGHMFLNCSGVLELNLSSFNTQNVENMGGMFAGCQTLSSLTLSTNFVPCRSMNQIFDECGLYGLTVYDANEEFVNTIINCDDDWQRLEYGWENWHMHFEGY